MSMDGNTLNVLKLQKVEAHYHEKQMAAFCLSILVIAFHSCSNGGYWSSGQYCQAAAICRSTKGKILSKLRNYL